MYTVKSNLKRVQPGAFTLADLQSVKIVGRAIGQRPPLVQFIVIAWRNDATVAYQYRRGFNDGAFQQFTQFAELAHFLAQHLYRRAVDAFQLCTQFR
ncbi:hypothetical protein D3C81_1804060 [compost metagenome]